jgi:hypothetical protein
LLADLNGDGADDLVLGAPVSGRVMVWFDAAAPAAEPGLVLTGPAGFGSSLAAEDLNGDGALELAVGASGGVWVHRGRPEGLSIEPLWTVVDPDPSYGTSLAMGDTNGDGAMDLVIGAPDSGRIAVYLGADGVLQDRPVRTLLGDAGFGAVLHIGDADSDGRVDLIVGEPASSEGMPRRGRVSLWPEASGPESWSMVGELPWSEYGTSIAVADIDGDSLPEVVIGAPGMGTEIRPDRGIVLAFDADRMGVEDIPIWGTQFSDPVLTDAVGRVGASLSVGDIDGDGWTDLLIGGGGFPALIYVGSSGGLLPWPAEILAAADHAVLGDIDGDGLLEVVLARESGISAWTGLDLRQDSDGDLAPNGLDCRRADSFVSPREPEFCDLRDSDCDGDITDGFPDDDADGFPNCVDPERVLSFAWSTTLAGTAAAIGDVDGDGYGDLFTTSARATHRYADEGLVASYRGARLDPFVDGVAWGGAEGAGLSSADTGDIDGDGIDDLVVGAADGVVRVYPGGTEGSGVWPSSFLEAGHAVGSVAVVDLTGDGRLEIAAADPVSGALAVWMGGGASAMPTWRLSDSGGAQAMVPAGDLDADGLQDVLIGRPADARVTVLFGDRDGAFRTLEIESPLGPGAFGADVASLGDLDGDGRLEIAVADPSANAVLLFGVDAEVAVVLGELRSGVLGFAEAIVSFDINDDGFRDLAVGAPASSLVSLHLGGPYGLSLTAVRTLTGWDAGAVAPGASLAAGEVDGRPGQELLVGDGGAERAWLFRGTADADADGLDDRIEWVLGLDPSLADTDGDGRLDGLEVGDPAAPLDTDADGIPDALDLDSDADGIPDAVDNCPVVRNPDQADDDGDGIGNVCAEGVDCAEDPDDGRWLELGVTVTDLAPEAGFQGHDFGHFARGRALVAADFDLDGQVDFYVGNPGDESYVLRASHAAGEPPSYEVVQLLLNGALAWAASAADYDNDGDYDLYVSGGGNECLSYDFLFRNLMVETGELRFEDVTAEAGVAGWVHEGTGTTVPAPSANGVWGDVDRDGDVDLFVSGNHRTACAFYPSELARNTLWLNNGDGSFTDGTVGVGLDATLLGTRHSTWVDVDNDGDLDLYENNYKAPNILWRNTLVETGELRFTDVTRDAVGADGSSLSGPLDSFASCAEDFDNDGWQDIVTFNRSGPDCSGDPASPFYVEGSGHRLMLNQWDGTFQDQGVASGLTSDLLADPSRDGVMGCQLGDLNADGVLDVYIANGGPRRGESDQLFISDSAVGEAPTYVWATPLIDWPAADDGSVSTFPPYPYRAHGTVMVDVDGDGLLEVGVVNGGPDFMADTVREPNRLFDFDWDEPGGTFRIRPVGDGVRVSRDAIGTRMALTTVAADGSERVIHRTLSGGSCFSAQNGFEVFFGLGDAVAITRLELRWPDGSVGVRTSGLAVGGSVVVAYP